MIWLPENLVHGIGLLNRWLPDSFFAATILLGLGMAVLRCVRSTFLRQRLAEGVLWATLLTAILAAIPGIRPWSLGIVAAPAKVIAPAKSGGAVHIGLIRHFSPDGRAHSAAGALPAASGPNGLLKEGHDFAQKFTRVIHFLLPPIGLIELLYLTGTAVCLMRVLLAFFMLRHLVRKSVAADPALLAQWHEATSKMLSGARLASRGRTGGPVELRVSREIRSPMTFGLLRRYVLIPELLIRDCPEETLAAIFRHEAAHVQRRDGWSQILGAVAGAVYFYHPLIHLMRRWLCRDRELIADHVAADMCGGKLEYAEQLLRAAKMCGGRTSAALALGLANRDTDIRSRILQLTEPDNGSMTKLSRRRLAVCGVCLLAVTAGISMVTLRAKAGFSAGMSASGGTALPPRESWAVAAEHCRKKGIAFLLQRQNANGAWLGRYGPAVTALVLKALMQAGYGAHSRPVRRGLAFIESQRHADGGFYGDTQPLYNTAIVIRALTAFHNSRIRSQIAAARRFLKTANAMPSSAIEKWFQSSQTRSSSATPWADTGRLPVTADIISQSELLRTAVRMAERPTDLTAHAGFMHNNPRNRASGTLHAGADLDSHERSAEMRLANYGNISYSQLKSMIYAGLSANDVRTRRLLAWLGRHYTLATNPAEGSTRGLFYYYLTTAEVLRASGRNTILDSRGNRRNWRRDMGRRLANMQQADGSWQNRIHRGWLEGNPVMATTYAVLTLEQLRPPHATGPAGGGSRLPEQ